MARRTLQIELDAAVADLVESSRDADAELSELFRAWAEGLGKTVDAEVVLVRSSLSVHERRNRR